MKKYLNFAYRSIKEALIEFLVILIDLSNSMLSDDWPPSRKAAATKANIELIKIKAQQHPDDIVGIIGFGTDAKVLHPPVCLREGTGSLCQALKSLPDMNWTNFTAALELAEACLFGKFGSKAALPGKGISGFLSWLLYGRMLSMPAI
jgi:Mg-chelatase subunit ChlD